MAITSILQSNAAISAYGSQEQGNGAQKNQNPLAGLQRKFDSTSAELSAFGKVKFSLDDLKAKAQAVQNLSNPPTLSDFKVAVQGVVQSFNALSKTVSAAAAARQANATSSTINDVRSSQALSEIRKAVAGPEQSSLVALQKIGISRQQDGTFEVNQKQLEKSFQDNRDETLRTLSEVSSRVAQAADKQLSGNGNIGQKFNDLSQQAIELENTRASVQVRLDNQKNFQQQLASQLASVGGYIARNAVVTYLSVASL